jgi:quinol-cytochrome oxidoreductase complex cytochrome b subunit
MSEDITRKDETIPFYPDHLRTEARVAVGLLVIVFLIGVAGLLAPLGLGEPADPMDTPAHVKPEWYFLGLYQLLKYVSKTSGVVIPILALAILVLIPFIDRKPDQSRRIYRVRFILAAAVMIILIALTIWGEIS